MGQQAKRLMNLPDLVRNNPVYQSIFAVGAITTLLIATAVIRYYTVLDRFDPNADPASVLSRYTIVEIALLLITIGCVIFIWFFLLQGRLAGFIIFNFSAESRTPAVTSAPLIGLEEGNPTKSILDWIDRSVDPAIGRPITNRPTKAPILEDDLSLIHI